MKHEFIKWYAASQAITDQEATYEIAGMHQEDMLEYFYQFVKETEMAKLFAPGGLLATETLVYDKDWAEPLKNAIKESSKRTMRSFDSIKVLEDEKCTTLVIEPTLSACLIDLGVCFAKNGQYIITHFKNTNLCNSKTY